MRILLISPVSDDDVHHHILRELPFTVADGFFAPHGCAVIAGLTPPEHQVHIHDENLHGPVERVMERGSFDVVGISLVANAYRRAVAIGELFREKRLSGVLVAGGTSMLHMWQRLKGLLDVAFIGEAEETWPTFLSDLEEGRHRSLYRRIAKTDMASCPVPRWQLIGPDIPRYTVASVQTVRGCPYDCTFCDVIYTFGRKLRFKSVDQVIQEIRLLESLGAGMVYFADDNFAADRKHARAVLRRLVELNKSFEVRLNFATQVDITIADDDELLQLMLDANMIEVQIGIESVDEASLRDIHKLQNVRRNLVEAVRKIQSYGIVVLAHMIVGMDSDDVAAFSRAEGFLKEANIVHQACHPLMAPPGTKLWYELKSQGRLVDVTDEMHDRMDLYTNVVPNGMSRIELIEGLANYRQRVSEPKHFLGRALGFVKGVKHRPTFHIKNEPSPWRFRKMLFGMLKHFLVQAPRVERKVFFRLFAETAIRRPELLSKVGYALFCLLMEQRHAAITAEWAQQIAAEERRLPDGPPTLQRSVVIAEAVRRSFSEIVTVAYHRVSPKVSDRDTLYQVVLEAVIDYANRHGETLDDFDEYGRDAVEKSCDRILGGLPPSARADNATALPESRPDRVFIREVLDAMDQSMRFGIVGS